MHPADEDVLVTQHIFMFFEPMLAMFYVYIWVDRVMTFVWR